ncbi:MAG: 3-phosphoshikimate 1-carboxyvinyltransferase [Oscillospiraceae bacterium]
MDIIIEPRVLRGRVKAIASKSDTHRKLICSALCSTKTEILFDGGSQDIEATISSLQALGALVEHTQSGVMVSGGLCGKDKAVEVECGESGSTLRFLLPVAAALGIKADFVGEGRLPKRPMNALCGLLREHGAIIDSDYLPIHVGGILEGGQYSIRGDISSQYISGLMFALPMLSSDSEIVLTSPLESAGYVELTRQVLKQFGIIVLKTQCGWKVRGNQKYTAGDIVHVEGDWSNAAFWFGAGALGGCIQIYNLSENSVQGDKIIENLACAFGARVQHFQDGVTVFSEGTVNGEITVDARDIPDLVPVLCVLACGTNGTTIIENCARLRLKESDRIKAVCDMIDSLGGNAREDGDSIVIKGMKTLRGGVVDSQNDHRIAMAAAIASIMCKESVIVKNADAVNKSYPDFWRDFNSLGGKADVV